MSESPLRTSPKSSPSWLSYRESIGDRSGMYRSLLLGSHELLS
ncbi:hypothetical protein [Rhodoglobus sp.]